MRSAWSAALLYMMVLVRIADRNIAGFEQVHKQASHDNRRLPAR
jgi:hypothetical protein